MWENVEKEEKEEKEEKRFRFCNLLFSQPAESSDKRGIISSFFLYIYFIFHLSM